MNNEIQHLRKALMKARSVGKTPYSDRLDFSLLGKAGEIVPKIAENW
jgi:hypothetical protein